MQYPGAIFTYPGLFVGAVVHVVSSLVFSVLTPALNLSVPVHDVFLSEHFWAVLVPVLNWPSAQPVHLVSSLSLTLATPGVKDWAAGHAVFLAEHAVALLLYWPSAHVMGAAVVFGATVMLYDIHRRIGFDISQFDGVEQTHVIASFSAVQGNDGQHDGYC